MIIVSTDTVCYMKHVTTKELPLCIFMLNKEVLSLSPESAAIELAYRSLNTSVSATKWLIILDIAGIKFWFQVSIIIEPSWPMCCKDTVQKKIYKICFHGFFSDTIQSVTSGIISGYLSKWGKHITAWDQGLTTPFEQNICLLVQGFFYKAYNKNPNRYQ